MLFPINSHINLEVKAEAIYNLCFSKQQAEEKGFAYVVEVEDRQGNKFFFQANEFVRGMLKKLFLGKDIFFSIDAVYLKYTKAFSAFSIDRHDIHVKYIHI